MRSSFKGTPTHLNLAVDLYLHISSFLTRHVWHREFDGSNSLYCCAESFLSGVSDKNKLLTGVIVRSCPGGVSTLINPHIDIIGAVGLGRVEFSCQIDHTEALCIYRCCCWCVAFSTYLGPPNLMHGDQRYLWSLPFQTLSNK